MIYTYMPNFIWICLQRGKKHQILWNSQLNILWWHHLAVQRQSWMWLHNYKPFPKQRHQEHFHIQTSLAGVPEAKTVISGPSF